MDQKKVKKKRSRKNKKAIEYEGVGDVFVLKLHRYPRFGTDTNRKLVLQGTNDV